MANSMQSHNDGFSIKFFVDIDDCRKTSSLNIQQQYYETRQAAYLEGLRVLESDDSIVGFEIVRVSK